MSVGLLIVWWSTGVAGVLQSLLLKFSRTFLNILFSCEWSSWVLIGGGAVGQPWWSYYWALTMGLVVVLHCNYTCFYFFSLYLRNTEQQNVGVLTSGKEWKRQDREEGEQQEGRKRSPNHHISRHPHIGGQITPCVSLYIHRSRLLDTFLPSCPPFDLRLITVAREAEEGTR